MPAVRIIQPETAYSYQKSTKSQAFRLVCPNTPISSYLHLAWGVPGSYPFSMTEKHSDIPRSSSSSPSEGSSRCSTPDPLDIAAYNDLMTARLPIIPPVKTIEELVQAQPSRSSLAANGTCTRIAQPEDEDGDAGMIDGRPMTKAEKQNAKKKRRKEREKAMKEQEAKEREEEVERERQRVKRAEAEKVAIRESPLSLHTLRE